MTRHERPPSALTPADHTALAARLQAAEDVASAAERAQYKWHGAQGQGTDQMRMIRRENAGQPMPSEENR